MIIANLKLTSVIDNDPIVPCDRVTNVRKSNYVHYPPPNCRAPSTVDEMLKEMREITKRMS